MGHSVQEDVMREELLAWERDHLWLPFTHMEDYWRHPLILVRGEGCRVFDLEGRAYYDGTASIWLNVHGHRHPELEAALKAQLEAVSHTTLLGASHPPAIRLARRLAERTGLPRVFFGDNGAGAVEAALKIAVQYFANQGEERPWVLGFALGYHGDTLGAVGLAPDPLFHWSFTPLLPPHPRVPYPYPYREGAEGLLERALERVERAVRAHEGRLAGVIVEPVAGAGGVILPPKGFLRELRALCDRFGLLLIVDEVATGFGRTGRLFAYKAEGIRPDILCLGKGLTGGYLPMGATLVREEIFRAFLGGYRRTFFHGHSYAGNPLAAALALKSLELLEALLPELPGRAERLGAALAPLAEEPFVGEVRQAGFLVGVELVADRRSRRPFPYEAQAGWVVARRARALGLLVRPIGNVLVFTPPLATSLEDLEAMAAILRQAFAETREALRCLASL